MSCRHNLAIGTCVGCYPANPLGIPDERRILPGPEGDYDPNLDGTGAVPVKPSRTNARTYIASRASLPERSTEWRRLRDDLGWKITPTWIAEAGAGQTADLGALWVRIEKEIAGSEQLVLYVETEDFPLKGSLVEVGIALAHRIPIRVVAPDVVLDPVRVGPGTSAERSPSRRSSARKAPDATASP